MGFFNYLVERHQQILSLLTEHIQLTAIAIFVSILIGVPLGIVINRYDRLYKYIMGFANVVQAIPSMAILGFTIPLLGIGRVPAIFMVTLYALLPIIKNTATGLGNINKDTLEAAKGIGMTEAQVLFKVQFPMALPVIMAGVRISAVSSVGLMTLASMIGAGGLGYLIYSGIQMVSTNMILAGAIPACILALIVDFLFGKIEQAVTPVSLRTDIELPDSEEGIIQLKKRGRNTMRTAAALMAMLLVYVGVTSIDNTPDTIIVTSKPYTEQQIMGNMAADLLEAHTNMNVVRKLNLGGTQVCHNALASGEADVHVEYTSSMFMAVLGQEISRDRDYIFNYVKEQYDEQYNMSILPDWGFNNTYGLAVKRSTAEKYNLTKISDLVGVSQNLVFTPTFEFSNREDGMIGLTREYGLTFKEVVPVDGGLRYTAIDNDECDIIVAYTTDSLPAEYDLVFLEDDKNFFLPYYAVPVVRNEILEEYPEVADALNRLAGELDEETIAELNRQVEVEGRLPEEVSKTFLTQRGYI